MARMRGCRGAAKEVPMGIATRILSRNIPTSFKSFRETHSIQWKSYADLGPESMVFV